MKKILMITAAMAVTGLVQAAMPLLDGTNIVGFTEVIAQTNANTIITVPFEACLGSGPGMLADLVATNGLTAQASDTESADQLIVLTTNATDQVYYYYWLKAGEGWTGLKSVKVVDGQPAEIIDPMAATNFPVARGLGFWIKRVAGTSGTLYLKGQVSSANQETPIGKGLNLIGYSTVDETFNLNTLNWAGVFSGGFKMSTGDRIAVRKAGGGYNYYHYFSVAEPGQYEAFNNKWVKSTPTGFELPAALKAGEGFWYDCKTVGGFTFRPND
ncbi:MAG: hypothetical protein PHV28_07140 [Kiritimatiellae bacterium]|nr:hypothetical protein [Kiritimatiellia bacterium]